MRRAGREERLSPTSSLQLQVPQENTPHPQENTPHSPSPLAPTAAASSLPSSCLCHTCHTSPTLPRHPQSTSELTSEQLLHS